MQQLIQNMATPQFITLDKHLEKEASYCGMNESEFAVVENSVLLDGGQLLGRQVDIGPVVRRFAELFVGATVVLPGDVPLPEESSLRKLIVAAGGSCYFLSEGETFGQVANVARERMRRVQLSEGIKPSAGIYSADALNNYHYSPEEQESLRHSYQSDNESGSILS